MGLLLVDDLASVDPVLQHQIERAAREWLAAAQATRCARPQLAPNAAGVELVLQQPDRAEFGIAAKNEAHGLRLALDDDELAVLCPIPERHHPAHPHPFLLRGSELVADALADDLALELREGQQNVEGQAVESRCGAVAVGRAYLLPPLSSGGASLVRPWLRFHTPLIEPDMQICRIRLSDKTSRLHPRRAPTKPCEAYEPEVPVKVREGITPALASPDFVLVPAQPHSRVAVERAICFAGGADTEVIGPSAKRAVQHVDELCGLLPATRSVGQRMDSFDHALDALSLTAGSPAGPYQSLESTSARTYSPRSQTPRPEPCRSVSSPRSLSASACP